VEGLAGAAGYAALAVFGRSDAHLDRRRVHFCPALKQHNKLVEARLLVRVMAFKRRSFSSGV
jgi:hypothetical protein